MKTGQNKNTLIQRCALRLLINNQTLCQTLVKLSNSSEKERRYAYALSQQFFSRPKTSNPEEKDFPGPLSVSCFNSYRATCFSNAYFVPLEQKSTVQTP